MLAASADPCPPGRQRAPAARGAAPAASLALGALVRRWRSLALSCARSRSEPAGTPARPHRPDDRYNRRADLVTRDGTRNPVTASEVDGPVTRVTRARHVLIALLEGGLARSVTSSAIRPLTYTHACACAHLWTVIGACICAPACTEFRKSRHIVTDSLNAVGGRRLERDDSLSHGVTRVTTRVSASGATNRLGRRRMSLHVRTSTVRRGSAFRS